jgi:IS30 family transposase
VSFSGNRLHPGGTVLDVTNDQNRKLTDEQRRLVIERAEQRRRCTWKAIANELGVSVSTVRKVEREHRRESDEHFVSYANP